MKANEVKDALEARKIIPKTTKHYGGMGASNIPAEPTMIIRCRTFEIAVWNETGDAVFFPLKKDKIAGFFPVPADNPKRLDTLLDAVTDIERAAMDQVRKSARRVGYRPTGRATVSNAGDFPPSGTVYYKPARDAGSRSDEISAPRKPRTIQDMMNELEAARKRGEI